MVGWICESGSVVLLHLGTLAALAVAVAGIYLAWSSWHIAGSEWPNDEAGPMPRGLFMAMSGLILSAFFALVIIAQWIPILLLDPCAT